DDPDGERRFVVLAAGMNDLLRPALYGARHRVEPVSISPLRGARTPADVVGPVCESSDCFATDVPLPPLATGSLAALLDAGASGSVMWSTYMGGGGLAELVKVKDEIGLARPAETDVRRGHDDSMGEIDFVLGATIG